MLESHMPSDPDLDSTVRQLLASETFEAEELPTVLAKRGYPEADVAIAVRRVCDHMAAEQQSPARRSAVAREKRANHLLRIGVLTLVVGLVFTLLGQLGWLQLLLMIAIGGAFLAAGYRGLRWARAPQQRRKTR